MTMLSHRYRAARFVSWLLLGAGLTGVARAQSLVINELMATNQNGIADGDGDREDWL